MLASSWAPALVALLTLALASCVPPKDQREDDPPPGEFDPEFHCGDGVVDRAEDCDEGDLGGATCDSLGFAGGSLGCDLFTCRYDFRGCTAPPALQNDDGVCELAIGCVGNDGTGNSGNPQSLIECYSDATLTPPFFVTQVSYTIRTDGTPGAPAPGSLDIEIYEWSGTGPPGTLLSTQPVGPDDLAAGSHTVTLAKPVEIAASTFCAGVSGKDPADGFAIAFSSSAAKTGTAWATMAKCNNNNGAFINIYDLLANATAGSWCISAAIDKLPQR